jgi:hypothetical protein
MKIILKAVMMFPLLFLLMINAFSGESAPSSHTNSDNDADNVSNENPIDFLKKFNENIKGKKWDQVIVSMGFRFNEYIKLSYKTFNSKTEPMKDFLQKQGLKEPAKFTFRDPKELIIYIFENSDKYRRLFKDLDKSVFKVIIDYYNKANVISHEPITKEYYKLLDAKMIRKLKLILIDFRVIYIRRDIRGWYFDPSLSLS